jgi:hypothetical protein
MPGELSLDELKFLSAGRQRKQPRGLRLQSDRKSQ